MKQLCILPCGKKKIWDKNPQLTEIYAKDAYIGVLHRLCRRYTDMYMNDWVIISAKHGLLLPEDMIPENYDLTFKPNDPDVVSIDTLKQQVIEKGLDKFQDIVALTGRKYQPIIHQTFHHVNRIQFPLLGTKGIGHMQGLLKKSIDTKQPLHQI